MTYGRAYFGLGLALVILASLLVTNAATKLADEFGKALGDYGADADRAAGAAVDLKTSHSSLDSSERQPDRA